MYRHSGIGRYLRNLVPLLLPLIEADRIRVLSRRALIEHSEWDAEWLKDSRLEFIETDEPIYSPSEQLMELRGRYQGSDLLWVPHFNAPLFYAGRMVVTMHDIGPLALPQILENIVKRRYARLLIERAAGQAEAILSVSEFTARELRERLKVPAEKITVAQPGIEAGWPESAVLHTEADGVPYLLFVGNVKPNKN